VLWKKNTK